MGGTRLLRKARRNKARSKSRKQLIKLQGFKPIIKSIDIEALKAGFKKKPKADEKKVDVLEEKKVVEEVASEDRVGAEKPTAKTEKEKTPQTEEKVKAETVEKKKPAKKSTPKAKDSKEPKAETKKPKVKKEEKEG